MRKNFYKCILAHTLLVLCKIFTLGHQTSLTPSEYKGRVSVMVSLYNYDNRPVLVQNYCNNRLALYMSKKQILLTTSFFEEYSLPLHYFGPQISSGSVSSAAFVLDHVVLVIAGQVYLYFLKTQTWIATQGITSSVSSVSSLQCCFSKDKACVDLSSTVIVYKVGSAVENQHVFLSLDGGFRFQILQVAPVAKQFIGGVYNMPTMSTIVAMVTDEQNMLSFRNVFSEPLLDTVWHSLRDPLHHTQVLQLHGMQGHLIVWSPHMLLYSPNHGIDIIPFCQIGKENSTLPSPGETILQVTTGNHGFVAISTSDGTMYYGRVGLEATVTKFALVMDVSEEIFMMFTEYGDLMLVKARGEDVLMTGFIFDRSYINVNYELTRSDPPAGSCPVEQFYSDFENQLFYIDIGCTTQLSAVFITSPFSPLFPLVTVTDAEVMQAECTYREDITSKGNNKYRLDITVNPKKAKEATNVLYSDISTVDENRVFQEVAVLCSRHVLFHNRGLLSTVTVDLIGRHIVCKDHNPLKAHILSGCPPEKHIRVLNNITACSKGILTQKVLQDNFSYTIPKSVYDPEHLFRPNSASKDLNVQYDFYSFYCPLLTYYNMPWKPTLELWNGAKFEEYLPADFVMFEVNGMYNYQYMHSVRDAKCASQSQNWTSMLARQSHPNPNTAWSRKNYKSCKDTDGPELINPKAEYQILKKDTGNTITFSEYNGMYIFKAIVVDASYSYCELSTTFSVYVYGALPPEPLSTEVMLGIFLAIFFGLLFIGLVFRWCKL